MSWQGVLKGFTIVCLLLLLAVSLGATHALAGSFVGDDRLAWAFALAIELGIIGLGMGIYVATASHQDPRPYSYTLVGILALSVLANFLHGAQIFSPATNILGHIRAWRYWWLLPLVFAAPVPVLVLRMTELAARLWLQDAQGATNSPEQPPAAANLPLDKVAAVVRVYEAQPATALRGLAKELGVSESEASRLRKQAMENRLLGRKAKSHYVPVAPAGSAPLAEPGPGKVREGE